jgi:hypothetical protein
MSDSPPVMPAHTYELPLGFTVRFSVSNGRLEAQWEPCMPGPVRSPRHRRKFLDACRAARQEFVQTVATAMGGGVFIVDADDGHGHLAVEAVGPAKRH